MSEIDIMAINAKEDENLMAKLIIQYENFILKCASAAARNYISKSDDEWSIALAAFAEAVKSYSVEKGSFLNFSELVIRRSIVNYIRGKSRFAPEVSVKSSSESRVEDEYDYLIQSEITKIVSAEINNPLKLEIILINEIIYGYGFSFMDLASCSPKDRRDKRACAKVVAFMFKTPILISEMKIKRQLPLNLIVKNTKVSRKFLNKHRKYIIVALEIMSGDFLHLSEYMDYIREGLNK